MKRIRKCKHQTLIYSILLVTIYIERPDFAAIKYIEVWKSSYIFISTNLAYYYLVYQDSRGKDKDVCLPQSNDIPRQQLIYDKMQISRATKQYIKIEGDIEVNLTIQRPFDLHTTAAALRG